jgi:hypothetical protein
VRDDGPLRISDRVEGGDRHHICGGLLLAPGWRARPIPDGWRVDGPAGQVRVQVTGPPGLALSVERRGYHPEFGLEVETDRLSWQVEGELPVEVTVVVSEG